MCLFCSLDTLATISCLHNPSNLFFYGYGRLLFTLPRHIAPLFLHDSFLAHSFLLLYTISIDLNQWRKFYFYSNVFFHLHLWVVLHPLLPTLPLFSSNFVHPQIQEPLLSIQLMILRELLWKLSKISCSLIAKCCFGFPFLFGHSYFFM